MAISREQTLANKNRRRNFASFLINSNYARDIPFLLWKWSLFVCLLVFCNKTFDLVCFLHFSGVIALYYIINKGVQGLASQGNLFFLNIRYFSFWHSGRLFASLQMPSLQNLMEFFEKGAGTHNSWFLTNSHNKTIFFSTQIFLFIPLYCP